MTKTLRVILQDQLSHSICSLSDLDKKNDCVLLMEVEEEFTFVKHHPKKIAFLISAMRHFAEELTAEGIDVDYITLNSKRSHRTLTETLKEVCCRAPFERIVLCEPSEYRLLELVKSWEKECGIPVVMHEDSRFFCTHKRFEKWAKGKKRLLMESFYREMRAESGLLMNGNKPFGGKWNYDQENRKAFDGSQKITQPMHFTPDQTTTDVLSLVKERFSNHFGKLELFWFAVTREQAKRALTHFVKNALPSFGDYQDAMLEDEAFLFHSVIAQYINCGLLLPREVCEAVEDAYHQKLAPLNAVEGYIRQILGWREYVRGIYFLHMPQYANLNFFAHKRALPQFYWSGDTKMNCMRAVIKQTEKEAYSHHIQRLMITGNFALLAGIVPEEVCEWYLAVYADAFDWVELPNTLGMALYGDGGLLASKPYAASGNYINKMSNFCQNCHYNVKKKVGDSACPFNYLYWDFLIRNKQKLKANHRLAFAYKNLKRMSENQIDEIQQSAAAFFTSLDSA